MAGIMLTSAVLFDPTGTTTVIDAPTMERIVDVITFDGELGREPRRRLVLKDAGLIDYGVLFTYGCRLHLQWNSDPDDIEAWRVVGTEIDHANTGKPSVTLAPLWMDLDHKIVRTLQADLATLTPSLLFVEEPLSSFMERVFDNAQVPAVLAGYTIPEDWEDYLITITETGLTYLECLSVINRETGLEYEFERVPGTYTYTLILTEHIGDADAGLRRVDLSNAIDLVQNVDGSNFFSRVMPVGGAPGEEFLAGDAVWAAYEATYDEGNDWTDLLVNGNPIAYDGEFVGGQLIRATDLSDIGEILLTEPPRTIRIAGQFSPYFPFIIQRPGDERVDVFIDPDAEAEGGVVEKVLRLQDAIPWPNWVSVFATWNFTNWTEGVPSGWVVLGTPTLTEEVAPSPYITYGDKAVRIAAKAGEGISLLLNVPKRFGPILSTMAAFTVISGKMRMEVEPFSALEPWYRDYDIPELPREVGFSGQEMHRDATELDWYLARIKFYAQDGPATFIIDAVTATNSQEAYPPGAMIGPTSLWQPARKMLKDEGGGGSFVRGFNSTFYDLATLGVGRDTPGWEEADLGDAVTLEHEALAPIVVRVSAVQWDDAPFEFRTEKRVRLGKPLPFPQPSGGGASAPQPVQDLPPSTIPTTPYWICPGGYSIESVSGLLLGIGGNPDGSGNWSLLQIDPHTGVETFLGDHDTMRAPNGDGYETHISVEWGICVDGDLGRVYMHGRRFFGPTSAVRHIGYYDLNTGETHFVGDSPAPSTPNGGYAGLSYGGGYVVWLQGGRICRLETSSGAMADLGAQPDDAEAIAVRPNGSKFYIMTRDDEVFEYDIDGTLLATHASVHHGVYDYCFCAGGYLVVGGYRSDHPDWPPALTGYPYDNISDAGAVFMRRGIDADTDYNDWWPGAGAVSQDGSIMYAHHYAPDATGESIFASYPFPGGDTNYTELARADTDWGYYEGIWPSWPMPD